MADKAKSAPKKPDHGKRLDDLEKQHADFREIARQNGWTLPE